MVSFKKALLGCVLVGSVAAQGAFGAERGGVFAGVELGANKVNFKQELTYNMTQSAINGDIQASGFLPSIALKVGHKWFFGESRDFGVRAYAQVGVGYGSLKNVEYSDSLKAGLGQMYNSNGGAAALASATSSIFTGTGKTYYTTFVDYFVGVDALYNLIQTQSSTYGVYAGVGVGGVTWAANGKEYEVSNGDRSYINFAASANVGIRALFDGSHEVNLGVRTYFPKSKLFEASNGTSPLAQGVVVADTKTYHYRPFSVLLSYVYSF